MALGTQLEFLLSLVAHRSGPFLSFIFSPSPLVLATHAWPHRHTQHYPAASPSECTLFFCHLVILISTQGSLIRGPSLASLCKTETPSFSITFSVITLFAYLFIFMSFPITYYFYFIALLAISPLLLCLTQNKHSRRSVKIGG